MLILARERGSERVAADHRRLEFGIFRRPVFPIPQHRRLGIRSSYYVFRNGWYLSMMLLGTRYSAETDVTKY